MSASSYGFLYIEDKWTMSNFSLNLLGPVPEWSLDVCLPSLLLQFLCGIQNEGLTSNLPLLNKPKPLSYINVGWKASGKETEPILVEMKEETGPDGSARVYKVWPTKPAVARNSFYLLTWILHHIYFILFFILQSNRLQFIFFWLFDSQVLSTIC